MKQKFDEILTKLGLTFNPDNILRDRLVNKSDRIELMEFAFNLGLETASENAEADCHVLAGDTGKEFIECYVIKNSILKYKL